MVSGGAFTLNGTINNAQALILTGPGAITLGGAVGGSAALTTITSNSSVSYLALKNNITTSSNQTFNGVVTIGGSGVTLTSTSGGGNGNVSFGITVNGAEPLTIYNGTGGVTFTGAVGTSTPLTNLTVFGTGLVTFSNAVGTSLNPLTSVSISGTTDINGGSIYTTGGQDYSEGVTLGAATTVNSSSGSIAFNSTIAGGGNTLAFTTTTGGFGQCHRRCHLKFKRFNV